MTGTESPLEMAHRHVRDGKRHIARQRALVARFRAHGHGVERAEVLLATFEEIQRGHVGHLKKLLSGERRR